MTTATRVGIALLATAVIAGTPAAEAAFPGQNGRLAYYQGDVGTVEWHGINVAEPDGRDARQVDGLACQEGEPSPCPGNPAWAADGRRLAYDFDRGDGLYVVTVAAARDEVFYFTFRGRGLRRVARPAWSPSGRFILFEARRGGRRNIYKLEVATDSFTPVTSRGGAQPAWSPDGRRIAFVRRGSIYVMPARGGRARLVKRRATQPNWSPGGRALAFVRKRRGRRYVYRMARNGRGSKRLARGSEPAWTPEGDRILFQTPSGPYTAIASVRPNGRGFRDVTTGDEGRGYFVYAPDQAPRP